MMTRLHALKGKLRVLRKSPNPLVKALIAVIDASRKGVRFIADANYRSIVRLQLFNAKNVHQTTSLTAMNRYPNIFAACQQYFAGREQIRILSYGCSTGEEVLTLRKYFPHAEIVGAEINKRSLEICRRQDADPRTTFIYSTADSIQSHGPYDAIFCLAVLQRTPLNIASKGIKSLKNIYPFKKFEAQIVQLDRLLNLNGLFVIHFSQYVFTDTCVAAGYRPLGDHIQNNTVMPLFDRQSQRMETPQQVNSIFVKRSD